MYFQTAGHRLRHRCVIAESSVFPGHGTTFFPPVAAVAIRSACDRSEAAMRKNANEKFLGVAGGTIERSCYSPHYVNTERDYERDYQATLPQGRKAADGCKPRRHGRDDRKREAGAQLEWAKGTPP